MKQFQTKYGLIHSEQELSQLELELHCFKVGLTPEEGGLGKPEHFRNIAKMLFTPKTKRFAWNPWAEEMLDAACKYKRLGVSGCANSNKTTFFAIWALINWLAEPTDTLVLVTSTSLSESRRRIWGQIESYYMSLKGMVFPGKLVSSLGLIRMPGYGDMCGVHLIPGEKKFEKEAIKKMIGIKAKRLFLIADELAELSEAIVSAFDANLMVNPESQVIGISNFASIYDPFGTFTEPKDGWKSISLASKEWETKRGHCIRFDGLDSPNIKAGYTVYPFLYNQANLDEHLKLGEDNPLFWRMCRSYPAPMAAERNIFSEADLISGQVHDTPKWGYDKVKVAAFDPAFTTGGDKAVLLIAHFGRDPYGKFLIAIEKQFELTESAQNTTENPALQIAKQFVEACQANGVAPENAAYDSTGAGLAFGALIAQLWSTKPLAIQFGGSASELAVSMTDKRTAKEAYQNFVTELWVTAQITVASGHVRQLTKEIGADLLARKFSPRKGAMVRLVVETKEEMKSRIGRSPDCFVAGTLVRTPTGNIPIESLKIGDKVITPFGVDSVIALHNSNTRELTKLRVSDGNTLIGKGGHKVFTWKSGWKRMDALLLTDELESDHNLPAWTFLNTLFTRVGNIGFKALVDTTKMECITSRRDFYIESFGLKTTGLFLRGCASIIKMATGRIIESVTSNLLREVNISRVTFSSAFKTHQIGKECLVILRKLLLLLRNGTDRQLAGIGIGNTDFAGGNLEPEHPSHARSVVKSLNYRLSVKDSALSYAETETQESVLRILTELAKCAAKALLHGNIQNRVIVPLDVQRLQLEESKSESVYNLTLATHNAYYANGVLVQNCGDAFVILTELARQRFEFVPEGEVKAQKAAQVEAEKEPIENIYDTETEFTHKDETEQEAFAYSDFRDID